MKNQKYRKVIKLFIYIFLCRMFWVAIENDFHIIALFKYMNQIFITIFIIRV